MCVCVCVCVCVFINLYITTQSGPAILVILCYSHWSFQGGVNDTLLPKPLIRCDKGGTFSLLEQFLRKPRVSCAFLPSSLLFCRYLGRQLLKQNFLIYTRFFLFPPKSPPFPTSRLHLVWSFLRFFASPPPSPILSLVSRSWALVFFSMIRPAR